MKTRRIKVISKIKPFHPSAKTYHNYFEKQGFFYKRVLSPINHCNNFLQIAEEHERKLKVSWAQDNQPHEITTKQPPTRY